MRLQVLSSAASPPPSRVFSWCSGPFKASAPKAKRSRNAKGALAQVASAISNAEADITRIDMGHESGNEVAELRLLVAVRDRVHLAEVVRALRRAAPVLKVSRVKP